MNLPKRQWNHQVTCAAFSQHIALKICKLGGIVRGDEGPIGEVAQVVSHGVKVVGVHGEEGQEKDEEVR